MKYTRNYSDEIDRLKTELQTADAIIIGAGAGLSTAAGFTYSGERFYKYFYDFAERFGITDMYSGGFYPFPNEQTFWAWWARHIYYNRYTDVDNGTYKMLFDLMKDKNYFVITTNVDHRFQKTGFDKQRLFYTQGDYGLFQSVNEDIQKTYDNEKWVMQAMAAQGFVRDENGVFQPPEKEKLLMRIPTELIPKCPDDNSDMTLNLRSDDTFVEDEGWHIAARRYREFLHKCSGKHVLFLELGVGANTPGIIKYPFWQMTADNKNSVYACLNYGQAVAPNDIAKRSIVINGDITQILKDIKGR